MVLNKIYYFLRTDKISATGDGNPSEESAGLQRVTEIHLEVILVGLGNQQDKDLDGAERSTAIKAT